jgi:hypothetical protein
MKMTCRQTPVHIPARVVSDFTIYAFRLRYVPAWEQWLYCETDDEQWRWVRDTTGEMALDVAEDHCFWEGAPSLDRIPEVLLQRARLSLSITLEEAERLLSLASEEVRMMAMASLGSTSVE